MANLLAAPAVAILMYGGIVTLGASLISPPLATGIGYIPWIATTYLYDIIHIFGSPAWSIVRFELGEYREYILFVLLSLLFLGIVKSTFHPHTKKQTSL